MHIGNEIIIIPKIMASKLTILFFIQILHLIIIELLLMVQYTFGLTNFYIIYLKKEYVDSLRKTMNSLL